MCGGDREAEGRHHCGGAHRSSADMGVRPLHSLEDVCKLVESKSARNSRANHPEPTTGFIAEAVFTHSLTRRVIATFG